MTSPAQHDNHGASADAGERRCEHGIRWPHECDDCMDRDIPPGKSITDHPCHGIFTSQKPGELAHCTGGRDGTCERCGTKLGTGKDSHKAVGPLEWAPIPEPCPFEDGSLEAAMWAAFPRAPVHNGWRDCIIAEMANVARSHGGVA